MRAIDADALIPIMKYTTTDNEIGVFPIRIGFDAIKGVIDEAPTIDAVEVVRCKDCKWYISQEPYDNCGKCTYRMREFLYCREGDFCSYGKRREDGEA